MCTPKPCDEYTDERGVMKKKRVVMMVGIALVILAILAWGYKKKAEKPEIVQDGKTITILEDGFVPESLTVPVGTTVRFVNQDAYWHWPASDPHPSHTFYSELDPRKPIGPNTTWEVTLTNAGTWGIHDHLAPYITGTITVQ